jgi:hypothetical protein
MMLADLTRSIAPSKISSVSATAAGDTAVWTAGAGKKWQIAKLRLHVSGNCAQAAGGNFTILLRDVTVAIPGLAFTIFVPGAAAVTAWDSGWLDLDIGPQAAAVATALNVNLSAALTSGVCNVIVQGWEL